MILSADRDGTVSASPVLFLPHKKNDITRKFDEVTLANGMVLRMTRNHLLPLCDGSLVTARSLEEGDCVVVPADVEFSVRRPSGTLGMVVQNDPRGNALR